MGAAWKKAFVPLNIRTVAGRLYPRPTTSHGASRLRRGRAFIALLAEMKEGI